MINLNDSNANRTPDLPACSAVIQPNTHRMPLTDIMQYFVIIIIIIITIITIIITTTTTLKPAL
jgi:hypothetical protein